MLTLLLQQPRNNGQLIQLTLTTVSYRKKTPSPSQCFFFQKLSYGCPEDEVVIAIWFYFVNIASFENQKVAVGMAPI